MAYCDGICTKKLFSNKQVSLKNSFLINCSLTILVIYFEGFNLYEEGPTPGWDDPALLVRRPRPRVRPGRLAVSATDGAARPRPRPRPLAQLIGRVSSSLLEESI